ncbi:uncharacterized protein LOC117327960 [Pecten maximus]|uniref:uncharacterized protein LOC117327960 n=1 Tax=Pecten maximus TaxID=6579 RepID=UPI00145835EC|nr:uncharacterized protein LOC117327960 [Pecten maximus]
MPWANALLCGIQMQDHTGVHSLLQSGTSSNRECADFPVPLLIAIENSDLQMVKLLLDHGAIVNIQDADGESALHYATQDDVKYEVMEILLKAGAHVNCVNKWSRTALHYVCYGGDLNKIELLLKIPKTRVDIQDENGNTCLHALMTFDEGEIDDDEFWRRGLTMLIEAFVDVNITNKKGQTALHMAAEHDFQPEAVLSNLLDIGKDFKFELQDAEGKNFLHLYISGQSENTPFLCKLLNKGFQSFVSSRSGFIKAIINMEARNGETPFLRFMFGSSQLDLDILQHFVHAGADVNKPNSLGRTPLHRVMMEETKMNRHLVCKILLYGGANTNLQDEFGLTPTFWARTVNQISVICGAGADVTFTDKFGRNALMNFMVQRNFKAVQELVFRGCNVNSVDTNGSTALHYAVWMNDINMVEHLLDVGGDISVADKENRTPSMLADLLKNTQICELLEKRHLKTHSKEDAGQKREIIYERVRCSSKSHWLGNKLTMNYKDIVKADNSIATLETQGYKAHELAELLLSQPGSGKLFDNPETTQVIDAVQQLVKQLSKRISECDPRFRNDIVSMGSAREGTKTGYPDEFDFVCCLSDILEYCDIENDNGPNNEGFVRLKLRENSHLPIQMESFFDKNGYFKTYDVRMEFFKLIWNILMEKEMWQDGKVLYVGDDMNNGFDQTPVLNFQILWIGQIFKGLKISIDFVPAIHVSRKMAVFSTRDGIPNPQEALEAGLFVLLHPPDDIISNCRDVFEVEDTIWSRTEATYDNDMADLIKSRLRVSCAPMEVSFLESLPDVVRESYVLAKIIKNECPKVRFDSDFFQELYDRDPVEIQRHENVHFEPGEYDVYTSIVSSLNEVASSDEENIWDLNIENNAEQTADTASLNGSNQPCSSDEERDSGGTESANSGEDSPMDSLRSDDTNNFEETDLGHEANNDITSYMLKNALFHLVGSNPEICDKDLNKDSSGEGRLKTTVELTIKIFELLTTMNETCELPVYFLPRQNVFEFAYEFCRSMDQEKLRRKIHSDGNRRKIFLDLILAILRVQ